jgi:Terpene cyclase DEP1
MLPIARAAPSDAATTEAVMKPKHIYLGLCVAGSILPLVAFLPFLRAHGFDMREFFDQLFATPVSSFFGWDVIVSSLVLWTFVLLEGRRLGMARLWAPIAANLVVGVSLGLPLFLYLREIYSEKTRRIT